MLLKNVCLENSLEFLDIRVEGGIFKESLGVPCISKMFIQGSICPGEETRMNMATAPGTRVQG